MHAGMHAKFILLFRIERVKNYEAATFCGNDRLRVFFGLRGKLNLSFAHLKSMANIVFIAESLSSKVFKLATMNCTFSIRLNCSRMCESSIFGWIFRITLDDKRTRG